MKNVLFKYIYINLTFLYIVVYQTCSRMLFKTESFLVEGLSVEHVRTAVVTSDIGVYGNIDIGQGLPYYKYGRCTMFHDHWFSRL